MRDHMSVFISHSNEDQKFVNELRALLGRGGLEVWNPDVEVLPGDNWLLETGAALEKADGLIFVFSKASLASLSTRRAVQYALVNRRFEGRLISVLMGDGLKIPWILKRMPIVNAVDRDVRRVSREILGLFTTTVPAAEGEVHDSPKRPARAPKRRAELAKSRA